MNLLSMGIRNGSRLQYSGYRGHNFWTPSPITNENQRGFNISRHNISSPLHKEFWIMRGLIFWRYDILKPLRLEYYKEIGLGSIFRNQYILYPLSNSNGKSEGSYLNPSSIFCGAQNIKWDLFSFQFPNICRIFMLNEYLFDIY